MSDLEIEETFVARAERLARYRTQIAGQRDRCDAYAADPTLAKGLRSTAKRLAASARRMLEALDIELEMMAKR